VGLTGDGGYVLEVRVVVEHDSPVVLGHGRREQIDDACGAAPLVS
jgi:hypothetical protein